MSIEDRVRKVVSEQLDVMVILIIMPLLLMI